MVPPDPRYYYCVSTMSHRSLANLHLQHQNPTPYLNLLLGSVKLSSHTLQSLCLLGLSVDSHLESFLKGDKLSARGLKV